MSSTTSYTHYNRIFDGLNDLFLYACTHGDYMLVYSLLEEGRVKADVTDRIGKSALQLAIEKEHLEVVKVLLKSIPYEQFRDALLLAIYLNHTTIADFILNHPTYRTFIGGYLDPIDPQAYDDSQFSSDITPLILAAQHNCLLIVHQLLLKGERIKKPHSHICTCEDCRENAASDSLRQAQKRSSAYRGLASEVYIALAYSDPILQAFELGSELRDLAKIEPYFGEQYKKLANQLSIFVARLLDNARGHEELEIVLNKTGRADEEKYETLARFDLAIQYREKPFVSHSNCQQKLNEIWYKDLPIIKNASIFKRLSFYLIFIIFYPVFAISFYILPKSKIGSLCQQTNLKFKAYIASYMTFTALIIASSSFSDAYLGKTQFLSTYNSTIYKNYIQYIYKNTEFKNAIIGQNQSEMNITIDSFVNCDISLRFMQPNPFEIIIFIWVIGFFWNEFQQITSINLNIYRKTPSNYVDCLMIILYIIYFILLYASMIMTRLAMNSFRSIDYWNDLSRYETLFEIEKQYYISKTRHILYWLNADRFYWKGDDLQNLAEAFFAMGNIFSICRICFLLPISAFVGPLQIMLDRMMIDIAKWIGLILIFFLAFACSLFFLFSFFAVALEDKTNLNQTFSVITSSTSNVTNRSRCPDYFFQLVNQSRILSYDDYDYNDDDTSSDDNQNLTFCEQSSKYDELKVIGSYPAIYYFGQSFGATLLTTFFTLFGVIGINGMIPDRGYELITQSCYKPDPRLYIEGFDTFISNLGFILYGLFTFICVTVLINTLIAMLEETIEDIDERADIEWEYARSKLYMKYIRDGNVLPVPLNLLPTPDSIMNLFQRIKQSVFRKKSSKDEKQNGSMPVNNGRTINSSMEDESVKSIRRRTARRKRSSFLNEKLTYKIVIERMVRRFLLYYKDSRIHIDDLKERLEVREVKNDISSFRFELSHELDGLQESQNVLIQSMHDMDENLRSKFDIEQIKQQLNLKTNIS